MKKLDSYFEKGLSEDKLRLATTATIAGAGALWLFGAPPMPVLKRAAGEFITLLHENRQFPIFLANYWFMRNASKRSGDRKPGTVRMLFGRLLGDGRLEPEFPKEMVGRYKSVAPESLTAGSFSELFPDAYKALLKTGGRNNGSAALKDEDLVSWVQACLRVYESELRGKGSGSDVPFRGLDGRESEKTIAGVDLGLHRFLEIWGFDRMKASRSPEREEHDFAERIAKARNYHRSARQMVAEVSGLEHIGSWKPGTEENILEMLNGIASHARALERLEEKRKGNQGALLMMREAEGFISQLWVVVGSNHCASIALAKGALEKEPGGRKEAVVRLSDHIVFLEQLRAQLFRESSLSGERKLQAISERVEAISGMLREANEIKEGLAP